MKTHWSTTAWIFHAVALASQSEPAKLDAVIGVADAINHAIPTHKELQRSFGRLIAEGLIAKVGKSYSLTEPGKILMDECSHGRSKLHDVQDELAVRLPAGIKAPSDDSLTQGDVDQGFKAYENYFRNLMNKK